MNKLCDQKIVKRHRRNRREHDDFSSLSVASVIRTYIDHRFSFSLSLSLFLSRMKEAYETLK